MQVPCIRLSVNTVVIYYRSSKSDPATILDLCKTYIPVFNEFICNIVRITYKNSVW